MGQKINPIGLRLGINRGWDSTWFAKKKDFGKYLIEDFKIREYIKSIVNSGVSEIIIERSSNVPFQYTLLDQVLLLEKKVLILKRLRKI